MRTTLVIDDDVLRVAKDLAQSTHATTGKIISAVFRRGYAQARNDASAQDDDRSRALAQLGIFPLPANGNVVTNEEVNHLREELGI